MSRTDQILESLKRNRISLLLLVVILAGIAVFALQFRSTTPGDDSSEAGFARDMMTHHAQAVEMALIIRDRTSDEQLFYLCTDIALTQQGEIGMMRGWLMSWDLEMVGPEDPMTWMGHPTKGLMPGMATSEQIDQLKTLPIEEAEVLFMQLMIRHHQGGVEMAQAILDRTDNTMLDDVAQQMILIQSSEIDTMNAMLEARGEAPITDPLPDSHEGH